MKKHRIKGIFDEEFRHEKIAEKNPLVILNTKVNWEQFRKTLELAFPEADNSKGGRPPYDRIMMFKILVLQEYYGLSDDQMEYQLLDRLSFQSFIGQGLHDQVPDAKTIWLFRDTLTKTRTLFDLFEQLGKMLAKTGLVARKGVMIDASFCNVPIQRNTKDENRDIKEGQIPDWEANKRSQKDTDADWTKKGGQKHFGYKQHVKADLKSKLITGIEITPASVHDSNMVDALLDKKDKGQNIYMDSAYYKGERIEQLKTDGYKPRILEKGYRGTPLTEQQEERNRKKSKHRARVEHIFGWIKQKSGNMIRAIGIVRVESKILLRAIVYNLSRAVLLINTKRPKMAKI